MERIADYFPIWEKLTPRERASLEESAMLRQVKKGEIVHNGSIHCTGLLLIRSGQLRAYTISEEGREITLYRLLPLDICLFSASCMIQSIQFDIAIEAEVDTEFWVIPTENYREVMEASAPLSNYTNQIMASRFSDVMWLLDQLLWKRLDQRLAAFLLEERSLTGSDELKLTHEAIGNHLGSAREVITRMLHYFRSEGLVSMSRGTVKILDEARLAEMAEGQ